MIAVHVPTFYMWLMIAFVVVGSFGTMILYYMFARSRLY